MTPFVSEAPHVCDGLFHPGLSEVEAREGP